MKKDYLVVRSSYDTEKKAQSFQTVKEAAESILKELNAIEQELNSQGYNRLVIKKDTDYYKISVPNTNIYYEWSIFIPFEF